MLQDKYKCVCACAHLAMQDHECVCVCECAWVCACGREKMMLVASHVVIKLRLNDTKWKSDLKMLVNLIIVIFVESLIKIQQQQQQKRSVSWKLKSSVALNLFKTLNETGCNECYIFVCCVFV